MKRPTLSLLLVLAFATTSRGGLILTFDSAIPGTLADKNGLGTGFTHRLPGTGSALPINDPNMDLLAAPGRLLLTSTRADINQGNATRNLSTLEAPGVFLPSVGSNDISISALFRNVSVPNPSDQLLLYVGVSSEKVLRVGMHPTNIFIFTENFGSGDVNVSTGANAFSTGDDILLSLNKRSGNWGVSWQNLTSSTSGSLPEKSLPWLDVETSLYAGVIASNARTNTSFVGQIDLFSANVVPEPSTFIIWGLLTVSIISGSRLKKRRALGPRRAT